MTDATLVGLRMQIEGKGNAGFCIEEKKRKIVATKHYKHTDSKWRGKPSSFAAFCSKIALHC